MLLKAAPMLKWSPIAVAALTRPEQHLLLGQFALPEKCQAEIGQEP